MIIMCVCVCDTLSSDTLSGNLVGRDCVCVSNLRAGLVGGDSVCEQPPCRSCRKGLCVCVSNLRAGLVCVCVSNLRAGLV